MKIIKTHDGSSTVYNEDFDECYHSLTDGAYTETLNKHILPPLIFTDLFYNLYIKRNVRSICGIIAKKIKFVKDNFPVIFSLESFHFLFLKIHMFLFLKSKIFF